MVYLISIIMVVFDIESFKMLNTVHTRDVIRYISDDSHDDVAEEKGGGLCCVVESSGVAYRLSLIHIFSLSVITF